MLKFCRRSFPSWKLHCHLSSKKLPISLNAQSLDSGTHGIVQLQMLCVVNWVSEKVSSLSMVSIHVSEFHVVSWPSLTVSHVQEMSHHYLSVRCPTALVVQWTELSMSGKDEFKWLSVILLPTVCILLWTKVKDLSSKEVNSFLIIQFEFLSPLLYSLVKAMRYPILRF